MGVAFSDDFLLANFVVPVDAIALARDIEAIGRLFGFAVATFLLVLFLDSVIGLALYVVLRPANRNLAFLTAAFRLSYAALLTSGLLALTFEVVNIFGYEVFKRIGYDFFALHIFNLGYTVLRAEYLPKSIGVLLLIASFSYAAFFTDLSLPQMLGVVVMLTMAIAEFSLSVWLIVKRDTLPRVKPEVVQAT